MRLRQDDAAAKELVDRIFGVEVCAPFVGLLVEDGAGKVHGAVIVNNHEPGLTADLTFAGRFDARSLRELARYLFKDLRLRRVGAVARESNVASRNLLLRLGFHQEGLLRDRFHDGNGVIFGLLPAEFPMRF